VANTDTCFCASPCQSANDCSSGESCVGTTCLPMDLHPAMGYPAPPGVCPSNTLNVALPGAVDFLLRVNTPVVVPREDLNKYFCVDVQVMLTQEQDRAGSERTAPHRLLDLALRLPALRHVGPTPRAVPRSLCGLRDQ
jgi:hypothetical protein